MATLVIAGTGLFAALTRYRSPEAKMAFFGTNVFILKKECIDSVMGYMYASWILLGLLIQFYSLIFSPNLVARKFRLFDYIILALCMLFVGWIIIILLSKLSYYLARRQWIFEAVKKQRAVFERAKFIVEHDGWRDDQIDTIDRIDDHDKYIKANYDTADRDMEMMSKLFDLQLPEGNRNEMIAEISKLFSKYSHVT